MKKEIPRFKNEKEEADFWDKNDSSEYIDWSKASMASFPKLKPSLKTISLRLPENMLNELKVYANKQDIPYQSFMKMLLVQIMRDWRSFSGLRYTKN